MYIDTDDEIKVAIKQQLAAWGDRLKHFEVTWFANEDAYDLELHFTSLYEEVPGSTPEGSRFVVRIGEYPYSVDDAFEIMRKAGRDLYFRLRKEFPLIKRNLSR